MKFRLTVNLVGEELLNCLEKNTQAQLIVTIHSGSHNIHKETFQHLFSIKNVRLTSGVSCSEKIIQAQLKVTIHSGTHTMQKLFSSNSVHLT